MSKACLVTDMPESCSKCKFMYEFYGVKKCHLLNILHNGGKAIISTKTLTTERKDCCPLVPMPDRKPYTGVDAIKAPFLGDRVDEALREAAYMGWNACIDAIGGNGSDRE